MRRLAWASAVVMLGLAGALGWYLAWLLAAENRCLVGARDELRR